MDDKIVHRQYVRKVHNTIKSVVEGWGVDGQGLQPQSMRGLFRCDVAEWDGGR